jgi:hypothetical protein
MFKINNTLFIAALVISLVFLSSSKAEEIIISDFQITAIAGPDSSHQCAVILNFSLPNTLDSTAIMSAELSGKMSFEMVDGKPMTLGILPIPSGPGLYGQPFRNIRENLGNMFNLSQLSTASFGESSGDTAFFDISGVFQKWVLDPLMFNGLLIIPLDKSSRYFGLDQNDPLLNIEVSYMDLIEE